MYIAIVFIIIIIFYFHLSVMYCNVFFCNAQNKQPADAQKAGKGSNIYSAITYRIIEMVGCQKCKCSSSWPPLIHLYALLISNHLYPHSHKHTVYQWQYKQIKGPNNMCHATKLSNSGFSIFYCNPRTSLPKVIWEQGRVAAAVPGGGWHKGLRIRNVCIVFLKDRCANVQYFSVRKQE